MYSRNTVVMWLVRNCHVGEEEEEERQKREFIYL